MKNVMKKMMMGLIITTSLASQAFEQTASKICTNDKLTMEVYFDGAPRGGDLVILDFGNEEKYTLYTYFTKEDLSTRCGIDKYYEASLYKSINDVTLEGELDIYEKVQGCGFAYSSAHINININGDEIKESLSCK